MGRSMAKARPLRKAVRKAGTKSAKNRRSAGPARHKLAAGGATRAVERPVVAPEIPPPLPAPIASFTF